MQGYSYAQLVQALQDWPVKSSTQYLANINRFIFDAERRLIVDLDLDIFDVNDQVSINQGATTVAKPPQSTPISFTAAPAQNAVSATLTANWGGLSGTYVVTFQDSGDGYSQVRAVTLTANATTATWTQPLAAAATISAVVNAQFIVERALWAVYAPAGGSGPISKFMVKRSYDFVTAHVQGLAPSYLPPQGQPRFYADQMTLGTANSSNQWIISPAADSLTSAIQRRYVQRPTSIVVAGNTFLGDNVGQLLFTACLMEAEHFLKADDRYADWLAKYQQLIGSARGELMMAWRKGGYSPMLPAAGLPAPPTPAPAQAQG